jgi:hypothetical protein
MDIGSKLDKVDESITIQMYDNGFVFEISGRDSSDEWASAKIVCSSIEEVMILVKEATTLPRS